MTRLGKVVLMLITLIILGVIAFLISKKGTPPTVIPPEENVVTQKTIKIAQMVVENATTTYTERQLSYPHSSPTEYPEIFNLVNTTWNDFMKSYGSLTASEANAMYIRADDPYQLYITTRVATSTKTVSYILEIYQYTGGAHGGTDVHTFTYDIDGKLVTLDKVFTEGYLAKIAPMARQYFYTKLGEDSQKYMIDSGTEATEDNFSLWYLTDDTVTFLFGQYQVGPYVLGIQEYPIKKSDISDILKPEFR